MILAIDTSTAACSAALFDADGHCLGKHDELIGRGHAERLVPIIEALLDGRRASHIIVGVGPGSFTGIRVGIAAAHGLAIGWDAELWGMSSLALLAASVGGSGQIAAVVNGGHGELFVQQFDGELQPSSDLLNLPPAAAAEAISADIIAGPGAAAIVQARGGGRAVEAFPSASNVLRLPEPLRTLAPAPVYARAPDAKVKTAA
jgi:tRNA threonylcarbamoyladenosine biosynthesis protein TsaB